MPTLVYHHRRAPVAAAGALSPASIALCVVGVVCLVVCAGVASYLGYYRTQRRRAHTQEHTQTITDDPTPVSIPTQPAITFDPATPALPSQPQQTRAHAPIRISQLPVSTSSSTLGSALPDEEHEQAHRSDAPTHPRRDSTPFAGPASGIVDVPPRQSTSEADDRQTPLTPTRRDSRHRSRPIPSDVLKSLGELPSLPPGPSPITRRSNDLPRRAPAPARSVDSIELTPVLDLGSNFRIASGIFGDSMQQNLWLSSVLDSAFQGGNNSRTVSPTKNRNGIRHSHVNHQHPSLTPSTSVESMASRRGSSSRIPVSRSQRQYLDQDPHAEMRTLPSGSDVSASSHHLSTRPSHGLTEHTAPTSVASTDSLSGAGSSDVQVVRADLAHKLPATTMRVSQVFPSRRQARQAAAENSSTASSSPASQCAESPQRRRKSKAKRKSEASAKPTHAQHQSFLAAHHSINGLGSNSETDLFHAHAKTAQDIMMHSIASSASLTAPFTTPYHRAVFPDVPVSCDEARQDTYSSSNGRDSIAAGSSPIVGQFPSTTPKISPKASFASQWKSKLARNATLHASPQLNYVKSRSNLTLAGGSAAGLSPSPSYLGTPTRSRSRHDSTPDISSSVSRQEEWHINTEDSRDEFLPIFTPCRAGFQDDEPRPSSGLGIGGVEELTEGAESGPQQQQHEARTSFESPVRRGSSRKRTTTMSPIMQANRWANATQDRQPQPALPPSPSLYDDDGKSFVSGHRGASSQQPHFDFDALTAEMSPRAQRGTMSPLDQLHQGFTQRGEQQQQTTPVLSNDSQFAGGSSSGLSPYWAIHPRSVSGRPTSGMVMTMHQVQDGVTNGWQHSEHASPRSEMGLFDAVSAGSCFSGGLTTEDGTHDLSASISAVAARARLLQSVQEESSREQNRQERELVEHQRRAEEAERADVSGDGPAMSVIEEVSRDDDADGTIVPARAPHQAKKPRGLSIYVGNAGGSLGNGIVSPLTPPFTPAKTAMEQAQPVRRYQHRYTGTTTSQQSSQSSVRMGAPSEESQDTVPELGTTSSGSLSSVGGITSPLKLRPLSLSTSNSVLGDAFDLKGSTSSANDMPTRRLSSYRSSRGFVGSESSGSLSSSSAAAHRAYGAYSHLTSALGLDNAPSGKRGSFVYKKPVAGGVAAL